MLRAASQRVDGAMNRYSRVSKLEDDYFRPDFISGLQVWLSARELSLNNDDPVSSWTDLSGHNNHATQATSANRPLFKTNVLNTYPVVRFDGSNDVLTFTNNINVGPSTIFVIGNRISGTNYRAIVVTGKFGMYAQGGVSTNWIIYLGADLISGVASDTTHRLMTAAISSGTTAKLWTNNANAVTRTNGVAYTSNVTSTIGASPSGIQQFNGDIAEVLVYDTALSDANVAKVNTFLMARYGMT